MLLAPGSLHGAQAQRLLQVSGAKRSISVTVAVGKTEDVRIDGAFTDITIGDSDVADISPLTDRTISILGKKIGTTRVTLYGEGKMQIGIFDIEVTYDVTRLATEIAHFSDGGIKVSSINGRIMLSGTARDAATLDRAVVIARQFAPDPINTVSVAAAQQVMLEVRFVEASRQANRALGVQWNSFGQNTMSSIGTRLAPNQLLQGGGSNNSQLLSPLVAAGVLGQNATPYGFLLGALNRGNFNVDVALNALEEKGLARSLAEPNLVALSGDTASFLAGGEFPIPIPGSLGIVTLEYKRYGVGLAFTPTVLSGGLINLKIEPEVSQLDTAHPIQVAGLSVPPPIGAAPDHGRAARRRELPARRPVAEQLDHCDGPVAVARRRAGARRALPQRRLRRRDLSRHHRHPASWRGLTSPGTAAQDAARRHAAGERRRLLPHGQVGDHPDRRPHGGRPVAGTLCGSHPRSSRGILKGTANVVAVKN